MIWQPPVMGSPLVGFGLKPKNNFNVFFTTLMLVGRGIGRERVDQIKTGNWFLPQKSTLEMPDPVQYLT